MNKEMKTRLSGILVDELIPALGCTEPIAIAYCSAAAAKALGERADRIWVEASSNIIKNVKSVIVPNSMGMKGITASAILGMLSARPDLKLEVLQVLSKEDIACAKELEAASLCEVTRLTTDQPLHLRVHVFKGEKEAVAEIIGAHTNLVSIKLNGKELIDKKVEEDNAMEGDDFSGICLNDLIDYAEENDFGPALDTLKQQIEVNSQICDEGLEHNWGAEVGRYHKNLATGHKEVSFNPSDFRKEAEARHMAVGMAAAGSDARMSGCDLPVIINSGSGNQGMTVSMPVLAYAMVYEIGKERLLQALALANLVALYQKSTIGRLSAFCGAVSAAVGSACGIAWMMGDSREVIEGSVKNSLGTVAGMVCDGAKPSCASKIAASVSTALDGLALARRGIVFQAGDGIVKDTADETIKAVGRMARLGMRETDAEIIEIMLEE